MSPNRTQKAEAATQARSGPGAWPRIYPFSIIHSRHSTALVCLAVFVLAQAAFADPLRIATWNLHEAASLATNDSTLKSPDQRVQEAAVSLGRLDPDVIILQQVRDWQMCQQLVQALQPATYSVQVCSAFRDVRSGAAGKQQIAILSKRKAYFSWSEPWRAEGPPIPGGFTFAALRVGKQRVGLFVVQLGDQAAMPGTGTNNSGPILAQAREACRQQWLHEVGSFKQWVTNRIEAVVIAGGLTERFGSGASPHSADEVNFAKKLLSAPLQNPTLLPNATVTSDGTNYVLARLNPDADAVSGVILDRCPATCDIDLVPEKTPALAVASSETAAPAKAESTPIAQPAASVRPAAISAAAPEKVNTNGPTSAGANPAAQSQNGHAPLPFMTSTRLGALAAGLIFVVVVTVWALGRRKPVLQSRAQTLVALGSDAGDQNRSAEAVVITTRSVTGSAADAMPTRPIVQIESDTERWRRRALAAEERADKGAEALRQGLMPEMQRWLKEQMTRKLLADRQELLETQQAAARKAIDVDERLSRIELQIQQQNAAYERRIDELTRELEAAKEENRELIRAKIAQVKAEMEAARLKALQQAQE